MRCVVWVGDRQMGSGWGLVDEVCGVGGGPADGEWVGTGVQ